MDKRTKFGLKQREKYYQPEVFVISPMAKIETCVSLQGKHIKIRAFATIGTQGFGFITGNSVGHFHIPHRGIVIIEDYVEIFEHVNICRGTVDDTVIGHGTKIDYGCEIAHNVQLGKRCMITAGVIIGGSAIIGDDVYIGIGAVIRNKINIGNGAFIGMGAVVVKDVEAGITVIGNPAKPTNP